MQKLQGLAQDWQLPTEIVMDMVKIALFDTIILVDDSGSMSFEENGERIEYARCLSFYGRIGILMHQTGI